MIRISYFKQYYKTVLTIFVISLLGYYLLINLDEISTYDFKIKYVNLVLASILLLCGQVLLVFNWYFITKITKCNLKIHVTLCKRLIAEVGKYLPGRILGYGYLLLQYKKEGRNQNQFFISSFYELLLSTLSAFIFFCITLLFTKYKLLSEYRSYFIVIGVFSFLCLHPRLIEIPLNFILKIKHKFVQINISYFSIIRLLLSYIVIWAIFGTAFYFLVNAFVKLNTNQFLFISGIFAIATFAGFMAFFLPAGLGAREGMMIFLLTGVVGGTPSLVIAIASRIWMMAGDLSLFTAANLYGFISQRKVKGNAVHWQD